MVGTIILFLHWRKRWLTLYDKSTQQTGSRRAVPQPDKGIYENPTVNIFILWVHVHLKKERNRRKRDLVMRLCFTWSPGKAERQTGRHRGARERETGRWRETMRDQETQRHTDGETERGMKREAAYSQRKHCWVILLGRQVSPESEPRPGGLARGIQSHCPREPSSE